ncbi:MAG: alpha/beta fold hydrolase [Rhodothermales bacterium]|nr:alpha/beta fold hydrolase [Rhodothermales bacterium]MBO6778604.1 alpha/beta fold hydrolase [Rhodothermales bacterium]
MAGRPALERRPHRTHDGCHLETAHFHARGDERGIILVPPLIGGSYVMFGRQFGLLVRCGFRVVSFNYRGHPPSRGLFDLRRAYSDTLDVLRTLRNAHPGKPLHVIGMCSGSLPLFHALDHAPELVDRVVFVNAIHHIQQTATPLEAARLYVRARGVRPPAGMGDAVSAVLDAIFPEIEKDATRFGLLPYENVRTWSVARDYLGVLAPRVRDMHKPALCCYGRGDAMLGLAEEPTLSSYKAAFRASFPGIVFAGFDADHFMDGHREAVSEQILAFLDQ